MNVERRTFASDLSLVGPALASVVPWTLMLAGVAYVESALMLYTALAIGWALHTIRHHEKIVRALILAGILAGFACGVKNHRSADAFISVAGRAGDLQTAGNLSEKNSPSAASHSSSPARLCSLPG